MHWQRSLSFKWVQCLGRNPSRALKGNIPYSGQFCCVCSLFLEKIFGSSSSTCLLFSWGLTVFRRSVIRLVNGDAETLVASPPPDHVWPWAMKGHVVLDVTLLRLRHGRLQALQGAGLHEAQGGAECSSIWRLCETERHSAMTNSSQS